MLPPLNLADSKGEFFGVLSSDNNRARKPRSVKILRPSPRASDLRARDGGDCVIQAEGFGEISPRQPRTSANLTEISMIPREFFVIETNAVLLPHNYPPNQYRSTLNAQGQWETVVFPALTPQNRQQVLYLRQTLEKMRSTLPQMEKRGGNAGIEPEIDTCVLSERRRLIIEYTSQETKIYSYCFHELARQIKCICKEQSGLLYEIYQGYTAVVARLMDQVKGLNQQNNQQQDQLTELVAEKEIAIEERKTLTQRVKELELQVLSGPTFVVHQDGYKTRRYKRENEDSESEIDEEEAEWRRQRDTASVKRPSLSPKRASSKELNLAATRLQAAYQKYQSRKEQTQVTMRMEKQAAAMDIQRSYRGFRERRLALHRRAVMRTILRRREENAAVELMQANVRAYFLNRRRSARLKLSAVTTLKFSGESQRELVVPLPVVVQKSEPATESLVSTVHESEEESVKLELSESKGDEGNPKANARQMLIRLLTTFRELASVIKVLHHDDTLSVKDEEVVAPSEKIEPLDDQNVVQSRRPSAAPPGLLDNADVELFQQTMHEVQALVGSLHVVLGTVLEEKTADDDSELLEEDSDDELGNEDADLFTDQDQQTQYDSGDDCSEQIDVNLEEEVNSNTVDHYDDRSVSISFGEKDAMRLQNYAELHLDDSLWSSAMYYPTSSKDMAQTEALVALTLASREQKKRLVSLKQFISDIYDTIVGKLKELPSLQLEELFASRCHLALSFTEWRQQRSQLFSRAVAADQPGEVAICVNFSIENLIREHFRCRLGLPPLIDAALASLHESIEDFALIDPDVKRFQEFRVNDRSEEELVFCCLCRYVCANRLATDDCPAGVAGVANRRQPMFHPVTMREVIDIPHALELARLLFRVEEEEDIVESDKLVIEVENVVYRQYLPANGYQQFESIVSSFFVDPDRQAAAVTSMNDTADGRNTHTQAYLNTCRRPEGSPRYPCAMVRATNYNQFHSKQYNSQAPRSPRVRHQQTPSSWRTQDSTTEIKWVYFEEVLALLIKYRGEMNHFHLFSYWVQELFGLAASTSSQASDSSHGRENATGIKLLDDTAFVETLTPLSLGPTERELRHIFHNSLRQRKLQLFMPLRVFTSVALLLLKNGLISVSTYTPLQKTEKSEGDAIATQHRSISIREETENKEWRSLALKWRTQEFAFEDAIEAIYHSQFPTFLPQDTDDTTLTDKSRAAHALQLLQLRQELLDLFASRSGRGRDLKRAHEIYEILINERLARVGGDSRIIEDHLNPNFNF